MTRDHEAHQEPTKKATRRASNRARNRVTQRATLADPPAQTASPDPYRESILYEERAARGEKQPGPTDIWVLRVALLRRLKNLTEAPRRCRNGQCRRVRRCVGLSLACAAKTPERKISDEEGDAALAAFHKALQRKLATSRA